MQPPASASSALLADQRVRRKSIISLTPLIDVVFILLVFFMLASSFMDWQTLSLDTATPDKTAVSEIEPFIIQVDGDDLSLKGKAQPVDAIVAAARQREPATQTINLQAVGQTTVQQMVRVLDTMSKAGITPLRMIDDPEWQAETAKGIEVAE
ncbi:MAG: biopolymer transporter ExbD [Pseudomonadota bacterium]